MLPERIKRYLDYCLLTSATLQRSLSVDEIILYNYANAARDREYIASWLKDRDNQVTFADVYIQAINQKEKVKVPQFVADVIELYKREGKKLYRLSDLTDNKDYNDWIFDNKSSSNVSDKFELVAKAWFFGYEVEKEKLYIVSLPGDTDKGFLNYNELDDEWLFSDNSEADGFSVKHTKKDLEDAGFGWAFEFGFAKEVED